MTKQTFYGAALPKLEAAERQLVSLCTQCPLSHELDGESPAVLSCISRIKSPDSMIAKLRGRLRYTMRSACASSARSPTMSTVWPAGWTRSQISAAYRSKTT